MTTPVETISRLLNDAGLTTVFYQNNKVIWTECVASQAHTLVSYQAEMIDYQYAYHRGGDREWLDISVVLYRENKPVGVWPLAISLSEEPATISSYGMPVLPPLFASDLSVKTSKTLIRNSLNFLDSLCSYYEIDKWESAESFDGRIEPGVSDWHKQSMQLGASASLEHELYIDLSQGMPAFKKGLRKSYKSLLSSGSRLWNVNMMVDDEPDTWEEFRLLHLAVAGKSTRSLESWGLQHKAIGSGQAMLVYLEDAQGKMVGGGYFNFSRDEALYSVGAYDRSLFDKPLGHVVQFRAIEEMMARKLKWYKIGARPYSSDTPVPNEKELSIAHFKQGFASHLLPRYKLTHNVSRYARTSEV